LRLQPGELAARIAIFSQVKHELVQPAKLVEEGQHAGRRIMVARAALAKGQLDGTVRRYDLATVPLNECVRRPVHQIGVITGHHAELPRGPDHVFDVFEVRFVGAHQDAAVRLAHMASGVGPRRFPCQFASAPN
jgi:hypothetical protein